MNIICCHHQIGIIISHISVPTYSNYTEQVPSTSNRYTPLVSPFYIKLLNGRIKICAGCKGPHMKGSDGRLLKPPNDICIAHREQIRFMNPHTGLQCSKEGNCYYHINKSCIIKKHPNFCPSQLVCEHDINLEDSHKIDKKLLQEALDFTIN